MSCTLGASSACSWCQVDMGAPSVSQLLLGVGEISELETRKLVFALYVHAQDLT